MSRQGGFLMADVISALVLLSTAFVGLLAISQNTLKLSSVSYQDVTAALIAQSIADRADLTTKQGLVRVDGNAYRWTVAVETTPVTPSLNLQEINVSVSWDRPLGGEPSFQLETARLGGAP